MADRPADWGQGIMIVSQRKIEANRRNAQRSTGPKTAAGKARSSRNGSTTHGLSGEHVRLTRAERSARRRLRIAWTKYYQPETDAEREAIDTAAHASIVLRRVERLTEQMHNQSPDGFDLDAVRICVRHERAWVRTFNRACDELKRLIRDRKKAAKRHREPTATSSANPCDQTGCDSPVRPGPGTPHPGAITPAPEPREAEPATARHGSKTGVNTHHEATTATDGKPDSGKTCGHRRIPTPGTPHPGSNRRTWVALILTLAILSARLIGVGLTNRRIGVPNRLPAARVSPSTREVRGRPSDHPRVPSAEPVSGRDRSAGKADPTPWRGKRGLPQTADGPSQSPFASPGDV